MCLLLHYLFKSHINRRVLIAQLIAQKLFDSHGRTSDSHVTAVSMDLLTKFVVAQFSWRMYQIWLLLHWDHYTVFRAGVCLAFIL